MMLVQITASNRVKRAPIPQSKARSGQFNEFYSRADVLKNARHIAKWFQDKFCSEKVSVRERVIRDTLMKVPLHHRRYPFNKGEETYVGCMRAAIHSARFWQNREDDQRRFDDWKQATLKECVTLHGYVPDFSIDTRGD